MKYPNIVFGVIAAGVGYALYVHAASVLATVVGQSECVQRPLCPDIYAPCENDTWPTCDDPCDNLCSAAEPGVGLICVYHPTLTCNFQGDTECPQGQRKTCKGNVQGVQQCDCYTPYLVGTFPCGSYPKCTVP
jgi:hypothetical protein